jgi:hypothetical protein
VQDQKKNYYCCRAKHIFWEVIFGFPSKPQIQSVAPSSPGGSPGKLKKRRDKAGKADIMLFPRDRSGERRDVKLVRQIVFKNYCGVNLILMCNSSE